MPRHKDPFVNEPLFDLSGRIYSARAASGEPAVDGDVASAF